MRRPLIAGNWKMNTTLKGAKDLVGAILRELAGADDVEKVICPPFIFLTAVSELLVGSSVELGAQNMYFEEKGAYTGEISPVMLAGLCDFVIIGHSERRQYFSETDEIINKKVKKALEFNLMPIVCVGESLKDNEAGRTEQVITGQVKADLLGINHTSKLVIAYEPIWAIGTGRAATGKQANATISLIRSVLGSVWDKEIARAVRILYGGSVTGTNIAEFIREVDIDGALVGGASLKSNEFVDIVKQTANIKSAK